MADVVTEKMVPDTGCCGKRCGVFRFGGTGRTLPVAAGTGSAMALSNTIDGLRGEYATRA